MSKDWFNFCLMNPTLDIHWEGQIDNNLEAISEFAKDLSKRVELLRSQSSLSDVILVMEHTGIYVNHLVKYYLEQGGPLTLVHANKVSELLAGKEKWDEKTDILDAPRLAEYGIRYSDKLELWQAQDETIELLQMLQRQRSRIIKAINILEVPANESLSFNGNAFSEMLIGNQKNGVEALKTDLKKVEDELKKLIKNDPTLKELFRLIVSVEGVGPVTAREVIITTSAFKDFTPNQAKQFARYAGVTPKDKQSGNRKRSKKTTKKGNKKIREFLTMGAIALIGTTSDLGLYYSQKKEDGKHHLSIINAMRNKMILRIFAVVRNQVIYDKNLNFS